MKLKKWLTASSLVLLLSTLPVTSLPPLISSVSAEDKSKKDTKDYESLYNDTLTKVAADDNDITKYAFYDIDQNGTKELITSADQQGSAALYYLKDGVSTYLAQTHTARVGGYRGGFQINQDQTITQSEISSGTGKGTFKRYRLRADNSGVDVIEESEIDMAKDIRPNTDKDVSIDLTKLDWKKLDERGTKATSSTSTSQENQNTSSSIPAGLVGTWKADGYTLVVNADGTGTHTNAGTSNTFSLTEIADRGNGVYEILQGDHYMAFIRPGVWGAEGNTVFGFKLDGDKLIPTTWTAAKGQRFDYQKVDGLTYTRATATQTTSNTNSNQNLWNADKAAQLANYMVEFGNMMNQQSYRKLVPNGDDDFFGAMDYAVSNRIVVGERESQYAPLVNQRKVDVAFSEDGTGTADYNIVASYGYSASAMILYHFTIHNGEPVVLVSMQTQGNEERIYYMNPTNNADIQNAFASIVNS